MWTNLIIGAISQSSTSACAKLRVLHDLVLQNRHDPETPQVRCLSGTPSRTVHSKQLFEDRPASVSTGLLNEFATDSTFGRFKEHLAIAGAFQRHHRLFCFKVRDGNFVDRVICQFDPQLVC